MHVEAASDSVECGMSDADVSFTAVNHNVLSIHRGEDWLHARLKHRKQLLVREDLDSRMVLRRDDWRNRAKVDLSGGDDRDIQNFSHLSHACSVMSHRVEIKDVLGESFLNVAFEEDCVLGRKSADSLCHFNYN